MGEPPIWTDDPELEAAAEAERAKARTEANGHAGPADEWPVMAKEAFHGPAGEIAQTIEPHTESDTVFLLINLHVFFGNAVGRGPYYAVEGTRHYPNLFALFSGPTSKGRKGTGDNRARQVFSVAEPGWCADRIKGCLSSGEGLIWEVRDRITKMVKDGKSANRIEEVVDDGVADKRLLIVQSEFSGALQAMRRDGSLLSSVMRDAWDRGDLGTLVKHSPARATGAHISIIGHITDAELRQLFDRTSMANGFGNRLLFARARRSKVLPFGGKLSSDAICEMGNKVALAIMRARAIGEVTWSDDGAAGWEAIYEKLSEGRPGLFGALTSRAEAQVVRLALNYALWDGVSRIGLDHLMAAQAVWKYCETSARQIFGDRLGDPIADTILTALKNAGTTGLTRTDISGLFSKNASAGQIALGLQELANLRLATMKREPGNGAGRPTEFWAYGAGHR
jgi:hypothetical protein